MTVLFMFILATVYVRVESVTIDNKKLTDNMTLTVVVGDSSEEDNTKVKATGSIIGTKESFTPLGEIGSITNRKSVNNNDSDSDNLDSIFNDFLDKSSEIDWKKLGINDYDMFGDGLETDDADIWKLAVIDGSNNGQQGHGWWHSQQKGAGGNGAAGVDVEQVSGVASSNIHRMLSGTRGSLLSGAESNSDVGRQGTLEQSGTVLSNNLIGSDLQELILRYGELLSGLTGSSGYASGSTNRTGWRNIGDEKLSGIVGEIGRQLNNANVGGFLLGSGQFGSTSTLTQDRNLHDLRPGNERASGTHSAGFGYWRDLSRSRPFLETSLNGHIGGFGGGSRWGKNDQDHNAGRVPTGYGQFGSDSTLAQERSVQESWPGNIGASGIHSAGSGNWGDLSLQRPFLETGYAGHSSGPGSESGWGVNWQGSSDGYAIGSGADISTGLGLFWKPEGASGAGSDFGSGTSGAHFGSGGISNAGAVSGTGAISELGSTFGSGNLHGSGASSGSGWWSGYTKNDALLARLLALLKAKLMASGAWQKWSASGGSASSQGYLGRGQPGNIVQAIKANMGKNDIGDSSRAVLGGYYRHVTAMRALQNQTSPATQKAVRQSVVNTNVRT